jgi:hypothetical protein
MNLRRWTHPDHPLRLASAVAEIVQEVRRRWLLRRIRRGLDIHPDAFKRRNRP